MERPREAEPPLHNHSPFPFLREEIKGESKGGEASLTQPFPLPLKKGKGDKGG